MSVEEYKGFDLFFGATEDESQMEVRVHDGAYLCYLRRVKVKGKGLVPMYRAWRDLRQSARDFADEWRQS